MNHSHPFDSSTFPLCLNIGIDCLDQRLIKQGLVLFRVIFRNCVTQIMSEVYCNGNSDDRGLNDHFKTNGKELKINNRFVTLYLHNF